MENSENDTLKNGGKAREENLRTWPITVRGIDGIQCRLAIVLSGT